MNLFENWIQTEDTDLRKIVKIGESVKFNGEYFSDAYCFDKGGLYEVLEVYPASLILKTKFEEGETSVEVHSDGLSSFNMN